MRPVRLLLDGFGCYRQAAEADFSDVEFFALVGPTGSGKSTVIDGLCFALYGTVPRWGKENAIAQALAPAANACRVCLVFEAAGKRYGAVRALTRDKKGQVHTKEARLELLDPRDPGRRPASRTSWPPASTSSPKARTWSKPGCRTSWGSPMSISPSRCCCRRAGSRSSCTPRRPPARTCWWNCWPSACTTRSGSGPASGPNLPPNGCGSRRQRAARARRRDRGSRDPRRRPRHGTHATWPAPSRTSCNPWAQLTGTSRTSGPAGPRGP